MSEGNRVWATLLGVTLLIGAVFSIGLWAGATYRYYGNPYSESYQTAYTSADKSASGGVISGRKSHYFKEICENPQSEDDANLCQQWRSANGARDSAMWGALQLGLGIVGIFGLAGTIHFAWLAWREAKKGAEAANRTNEIARAEQRPWVTLRRDVDCVITIFEFDPTSPKGKFFRFNVGLQWKYDLENVGRSPAFGASTNAKLICTSSHTEAMEEFRCYAEAIDLPRETRGESTIFQGERLEYVHNLSSSVSYASDKKPRFFLLFSVVYRSHESDIIGLEALIMRIEFDIDTMGPWPAKLLEYDRARITK